MDVKDLKEKIGATIDPATRDILDRGSDHDYRCRCDTCLDWWVAMGPDGGEAGHYGPFTESEIRAREAMIAEYKANPSPLRDIGSSTVDLQSVPVGESVTWYHQPITVMKRAWGNTLVKYHNDKGHYGCKYFSWSHGGGQGVGRVDSDEAALSEFDSKIVPSSEKFWRKTVGPASIIIDQTHYQDGGNIVNGSRDKMRWAGFGGREFEMVRLSDGAILKTNNLWHQGYLPDEMRAEWPDNYRWAGVSEA